MEANMRASVSMRVRVRVCACVAVCGEALIRTRSTGRRDARNSRAASHASPVVKLSRLALHGGPNPEHNYCSERAWVTTQQSFAAAVTPE